LGEDFSRVRLVKVDVEGAELQVLRGMAGLLRLQHPDLLVEVTDRFLRQLGDSAAALLEFLAQLGYVCYLISDDRVTRVEELGTALPQQWNAFFTTDEAFSTAQR
jgi:hypothetical protein